MAAGGAKRMDAVLYGTVLALALGGGAIAIAGAFGEDPPVERTSAGEAEQQAPPFVPDLPEVPDLRSQPPPAAPQGEDDPRLAELGAEMRYLSRARELLAEQPAEALAVLEQHRRRHPDGGLREQREAFAIEALAALGHTELAERRYYDFVRDYPSSELSARLAALLR